MNHELDQLLRTSARRELCDPPAGLAERVRARLDAAPPSGATRARGLPVLRLAAALAAAALLAWAFWPQRPTPPAPPLAASSPSPSADALAVVDLTRKGLEYTAHIDRPLADEWHLMVQNSIQLCDTLLGQLPNLPR
jgi:hypothetical protein